MNHMAPEKPGGIEDAMPQWGRLFELGLG